jgi:CspA family cold shock protein
MPASPENRRFATRPEYRRFSARARVREFSNETGWGVLDATDGVADRGIWFHWNVIDIDGYKTVSVGQMCEVEVETAEQDGYHLRALSVRPVD